MDKQPTTFVGNGNIAGRNISNVGNVAVNYTNFTQSERERGTHALPSVDRKMLTFDICRERTDSRVLCCF